MSGDRLASDYDYDVCLSFAGEDRPYVKQVAESLRARGVRVFYDEFEQVRLWGANLYTHLDEVYARKARFCVMFLSEHYARKLWTNHERASAQARAFSENAEYILPARFDDAEIPGVRPTIGYVDLRTMTPDDLAALVCEKLAVVPRAAAFIDGDWLLGLSARGRKPMDFGILLDRLRARFGTELQPVVVITPDLWRRARFGLADLTRLGYRVESVASVGPNSSKGYDVHFALLASQVPANVHTFVLISGDSDLAPLLRRLKSPGRTTVLISSEPALGVALRQAADEFIALPDLLGPA